MRTLHNPPSLYDPQPNGYSHVAVASAGTRAIYVAGQGGERRDGTLPASLEAQIEQAFANLVSALEAVGAGPANVTALTTYVVDHDEAALEPLTRAVQSVFGDRLPTQTLVPVPRLALDGMRFEVSAVAHRTP